jgi:hypothetical protein
MDDLSTAIPTAVRRRLLLNLCGFRVRDGVWHAPSGTQTRSEERVDRMSDLAFGVFIGPWLGSTTSALAN